MGKIAHFLVILFLLFLSVCIFGCRLDRRGTRAPVWADAGDDSSVIDGGDIPDTGAVDSSIPDSGGLDAGVLDSGPDASIADSGFDSGTDSGMPDSSTDSGSPDAGPPRILTYEFERTLAGGPVRSFWTREDSGAWRSMCSGSEITNPSPNVWRCDYDRSPLISRGVIRFYADFSVIGTSPACGPSNCSAVGIHRLYVDGVPVPTIEIGEVDSVAPYPPAGMIRVKLYVTP